MSKYLQLQMISMLQTIQCENGLQRGSITIVNKRFDVARSTSYRLWELVVCTCAMGDIISPEINAHKRWGRPPIYLKEFVQEGVKDVPLLMEEAYPKKPCGVDGGIKDNCASLDCCFNHLCSL